MNRSNYVILGVVALVIALVVVFLAWPREVNWMQRYHVDKRDPYDLFIFHELIKAAPWAKEVVEVRDSLHLALNEETDESGTYIFVGQRFNGNEKDIDAMKQYVAQGHHAFIIASDPGNLLYEICDLMRESDFEIQSDGTFESREESWWETVEDTLVVGYVRDIRGNEHSHRLQYIWDFEVNYSQWTYFSEFIQGPNDSLVRVIGGFDGDFTSTIEVPYGSGKFYFHSIPLAFSNYHLKSKSGMSYCRALMSYARPGKLYWDIENQNMDFFQQEHDEAGGEAEPKQGPLEYILSQPALRAAWYLSLVLILFYLVFAGRRKQRAVRTIRIPANTSIEFTEVVSQLFLKQKDHRKLVDMKMDMWRAHARERYRMRINDKVALQDSELLAMWSLRSGVPQDILQRIIELYNGLDTHNAVETTEMLQLHSLLETYYHNCK